ncbi:MAG: glycosyltransferase family 4 protein [Isosphaeraceae bacterium]
MLTTFFGPHSFGGDAAYVDRLSRALARRGHEVHVIYCLDSFQALRGDHPERAYEPFPGVTLHPIQSGFGVLSPIATQISGRPLLKQAQIRNIFDRVRPDVIHFHNISLIGGPTLLKMSGNNPLCHHPFKLMTAHEHWLHCPMHLMWKNDDKSCDKRTCVSCCLHGHRPPQYWRYTGLIDSNIKYLDHLIFPSLNAKAHHAHLKLDVPQCHIPYFLPDDWEDGVNLNSASDNSKKVACKPFIAAAGRLVRMKGFQNLIRIMKGLPSIDLRIAGTGPYEGELRKQAEGAANIKFEGLCDRKSMIRLFHGAKAVAVPSLFPETFGYVVLEAFSAHTPVIVHRGGGAIAETGEQSGGGLGYDTDDELEQAILRLVNDHDLRQSLAGKGHSLRAGAWSESSHLDKYLKLIDDSRRPSAGKAGPHRSMSISKSAKSR